MTNQLRKFIQGIEKLSLPYNEIGMKIHEMLSAQTEFEAIMWYGGFAYKNLSTKKIMCFFRLDKLFTLNIGEDASYPSPVNSIPGAYPYGFVIEAWTPEVEALLQNIINELK